VSVPAPQGLTQSLGESLVKKLSKRSPVPRLVAIPDQNPSTSSITTKTRSQRGRRAPTEFAYLGRISPRRAAAASRTLLFFLDELEKAAEERAKGRDLVPRTADEVPTGSGRPIPRPVASS
jgi:hypothetical protein